MDSFHNGIKTSCLSTDDDSPYSFFLTTPDSFFHYYIFSSPTKQAHSVEIDDLLQSSLLFNAKTCGIVRENMISLVKSRSMTLSPRSTISSPVITIPN